MSIMDITMKFDSFSVTCNSRAWNSIRSTSRNVITWSALIQGCTQHGQYEKALKFFVQMQEEGVEPNEVTFVGILRACSILADLGTGRLIHCLIVESHLSLTGPMGNTLIDMYGKCGTLEDAFYVFDLLPKTDVVTWSAMMVACSHHGCDEEGLELFHKMQKAGTKPDEIVLACALKACSTITALKQGRIIHIHLIRSGFASQPSISKHLIDLYIKCGSLEDASRVFDRSHPHSMATWNTIISGCAESGKPDMVQHYLGSMLQRGVKPNRTTFSCLLFMCSHMGLLNEGFSFYKGMWSDYLVAPMLDHFVSLVHLLGGTGHMEEAKCMLATMPSGPGAVGWRSLLSQCKAHSNAKLGQQCFEHVALDDRREAAGYVLMSNMAPDHTADESGDLRKYVNAWKKPAKACIEVLGEVHSFCVRDECHPEIDDVILKLKSLGVRMVDAGYMHRW